MFLFRSFLIKTFLLFSRMTGTDKAIFYISVDPSNVELAAVLYISVFKAERITQYDDGSVELKIFDSSVLVTSGSPRFRSIVELRVDPHTISLVIDSQAFVATDLKLNLSSQYLLKVIDPFQVIWLLSIKEFSDGLRYLPSCTKCKYPSHHRPALCSEMTRWQLMIGQSLETRELLGIEPYFRDIETLEADLFRIRECRTFYEILNVRSFVGVLSTTLDELERFNTLLQGLHVVRALNPTYEAAGNFKNLLRSAVNSYNSLLEAIIPTGMARETRELPNPVATRARAADNWRQLVKRCHSARFLMNNKLSKANTREELWMSDLLYDEVSDWRKQNI
ncbi:unnamed protein product [Brassica napus]|uniref:(rape) hypothetical protein n=1 Tax=Brassica napus TaxID=3708 RepID=A0A816IHX2_BRANA|nr:unnamed protein product [Brassica napus]